MREIDHKLLEMIFSTFIVFIVLYRFYRFTSFSCLLSAIHKKSDFDQQKLNKKLQFSVNSPSSVPPANIYVMDFKFL